MLHGHVPGKEGLKPGKTSHKMVESCINKITFKNGIRKFYNLVNIFYFILFIYFYRNSTMAFFNKVSGKWAELNQ